MLGLTTLFGSTTLVMVDRQRFVLAIGDYVLKLRWHHDRILTEMKTTDTMKQSYL